MTVGELKRTLVGFNDDAPVYIAYGVETREVMHVALTPNWITMDRPGVDLHAGARVPFEVER